MAGHTPGTFKHTEESKKKISDTMKGQQPRYPGFLIKNPCPTCGLLLNPPNMARHQPACTKNEDYRFLFKPELTCRQIKHFFGQKKRKFGLSRDDYVAFFLKQEGKCAICQANGYNGETELVVDHCHAKGNVRGLLCNACNWLLGLADDNTDTLKSAIKYLETHKD